LLIVLYILQEEAMPHVSAEMWARMLKLPIILRYIASNNQLALRCVIRGGNLDAVRTVLSCKEV
jgi:hypothetical protein